MSNYRKEKGSLSLEISLLVACVVLLALVGIFQLGLGSRCKLFSGAEQLGGDTLPDDCGSANGTKIEGGSGTAALPPPVQLVGGGEGESPVPASTPPTGP